MTAPVHLPEVGEDITIEEVCDVLMEIILPFYKGFPDSKEEFLNPKFRKALTGEETYNILSSIHHLIMTIKMTQYDALAKKFDGELPWPEKQRSA